MKTTGYAAIALSIIFIGSVAFLAYSQFNGNGPERIADGKTGALESSPADFQGQLDHVKLTESGLAIDTRTSVKKEEIGKGQKVLASYGGRVYVKDSDGKTVFYENGQKTPLNFDATYGAVAGDFPYPGFNVIYANSDREVYVKNLDTGSQKKLYDSKAAAVVKADADHNGVKESAEIRLMDGSTKTVEPVNAKNRTDIDNDGLKERVYLKGDHLYSYDSAHGQEELAKASSYVLGDKIYIGYNGKIESLSFTQQPYDSGNYVSKSFTFNGSVTVKQLLSHTDLNGGSVRAEVVTPSGTEGFELGDGFSSQKMNLYTQNATVRLTFNRGSGEGPVVKSFELVYTE